MKKQKEMMESFQIGHSNFIRNLDLSLDILEHEIREAKEAETVCSGESCKELENSLDELANLLYSISEPRWMSKADSELLRRMRTRIHDMYTRYRSDGIVIH